MPKPKRQKLSESIDNVEYEESDEYVDAIMLPNSEDSENSNCNSDSEDDSSDKEIEDRFSSDSDHIPKSSYHKVKENYKSNQSKLEPHHVFEWLDGEKKHDQILENEILLSTKVKNQISESSFVELFELFFSTELKNYILEATMSNDCNLTMTDLDIFIGIIILSIFNERKSQKDYWSESKLLVCKPISEAMTRARFLEIKSKIKLSNAEDKNMEDRAWRVRGPLEIFRKNAKQFGFFSTALSIDEMMVKFKGRTILRQFMQNKPVRFGIKMWAVCSVNGFLFDCDIYCGKNSKSCLYSINEVLNKCTLGSRVVLDMLQNLLSSSTPRKIGTYHVYFDNFFTSPDLLVHLKKVGLKATGTLRANRINATNTVSSKDARGTFAVKNDMNSGMNYITVMDSKPVSLLSTAAGVTPISSVERYSKETKSKIEIPFPNAFKIYNQFMGGVDQHDGHCSNLMPCIRSKKWTWAILLRLLQSSIANATVLRNACCEEKIGTKAVGLDIAANYLAKANKKDFDKHKIERSKNKRNCVNFSKCSTRTQRLCTQCNSYQCLACFEILHK